MLVQGIYLVRGFSRWVDNLTNRDRQRQVEVVTTASVITGNFPHSAFSHWQGREGLINNYFPTFKTCNQSVKQVLDPIITQKNREPGLSRR